MGRGYAGVYVICGCLVMAGSLAQKATDRSRIQAEEGKKEARRVKLGSFGQICLSLFFDLLRKHFIPNMAKAKKGKKGVAKTEGVSARDIFLSR